MEKKKISRKGFFIRTLFGGLGITLISQMPKWVKRFVPETVEGRIRLSSTAIKREKRGR